MKNYFLHLNIDKPCKEHPICKGAASVNNQPDTVNSQDVFKLEVLLINCVKNVFFPFNRLNCFSDICVENEAEDILEFRIEEIIYIKNHTQ